MGCVALLSTWLDSTVRVHSPGLSPGVRSQLREDLYTVALSV